MHYLTERNERRSRYSALVLAIVLHLGFAAALYLYTAQPGGPSATPTKTTETHRPATPQTNIP